MEELEMLDLGDVELEEVERGILGGRRPFPTVTVGTACLYFNAEFIKMFGKNNAKFKFYTTPKYVIIAEAGKEDIHSFSFHVREGRNFANVRYPSGLQEKKLQRGTYKLYKCKQGFAFDRYEPLKEVE